MSTNPTGFCWWELVFSVAALVVSAFLLPTAVMEDARVSAWFAAIAFAIFSFIAVICFWKLWNV